MIGRRFGSLVVVEKLRKHPTAKKDFIYHCRCDCGGTCEARRKSLQKGHKKSCGCLAKLYQASPWVGKKIGQLLVLSRLPSKKYLCRCDCGAEVVSTSMWSRAKSSAGGTDVHCGGAAHRDMSNTQHPLYSTWRGMVRRCTDPTNRNFKNYGARGVGVCDAWLGSFARYVEDIALLGPRPSDAHTLDRKNNNGGYEISNMRWATRAEQEKNKRTTAAPTPSVP